MPHHVCALQQHVHDSRRHRELRGPGQVEKGLNLVGERLDFCELEESGQTLDGVEASEDRVQRLCGGVVFLENEQLIVDGREMLAGFRNELTDQPLIFRQ